MKKILAFLVSLMMLFSTCVAEEVTTEEVLNLDNCEEFAQSLDSEDPFGDDLDNFVEDNLGKTIEFSGFIDDIDLEFENFASFGMGDWEDRLSSKVSFNVDGITIEDFRDVITEYQEYIGAAFSDEDASDYIYGLDVSVTGVLKGGDGFSKTIDLDLVSIHLRGYEKEEPEEKPALDTSGYVTLEKGSKGDEVKALQQRLIDLHYLNDVADGSYGDKTKVAVEKFQSAAKLSVTGIADPTTQAVLFSPDAPEASMSISCASIVVGSMAQTTWSVDGEQFTLSGNQTKTLKTAWGTYKFDAFGNYEKLD